MTSKIVENGQNTQTHRNSIQSGIVAGSIIFTSKGEIPVEYLSADDRIVTRDAGMVKLVGTYSLRISTPAVAIKAGTLGPTRPDHNMIIPAAQQILVRDWRAQSMFKKKQTTAQVGQLIDGQNFTDLGIRDLRVVHLIFEKPHIIYSDGLEVLIPMPSILHSIAA